MNNTHGLRKDLLSGVNVFNLRKIHGDDKDYGRLILPLQSKKTLYSDGRSFLGGRCRF
ncbi:MAG: hypothetical protein KDC53_11220 [Saprospiraceae bacterium]|nr:hypothetical protein [Saprospiraceae bacterium]